MAPRKPKEDSDVEWTPQSESRKVTKSTKARKGHKARQSSERTTERSSETPKRSSETSKRSSETPKPVSSYVPIFNEGDWRTIASLQRLGRWNPNNPEIPRMLGISQNAWWLRMSRLTSRLNQVELDLIEGAWDRDPAKIGRTTGTKDRKDRNSDTPKPKRAL